MIQFSVISIVFLNQAVRGMRTSGPKDCIMALIDICLEISLEANVKSITLQKMVHNFTKRTIQIYLFLEGHLTYSLHDDTSAAVTTDVTTVPGEHKSPSQEKEPEPD